MAGPPNPKILKEQTLLALDQSRSALTGSWEQAREQWSPRNVIQHSIEKHWAIAAASAAVVGFIAIRWFFPGRENSRDTFSKPARKRTISSFLLKGLWGMGREPLMALAAQQLLPLIAKFVSESQSPSKPPSSE